MAFAAVCATVGVEWGEADERGDLSGVEGAQFRQEGDERRGCGLADARRGAHLGFVFAPEVVGVARRADVEIGEDDALSDESDECIYARQLSFMSGRSPVLLGGEHLDEL